MAYPSLSLSTGLVEDRDSVYARDWQERPQPTAGPSSTTPTLSPLSQRRRSSAAHTRPSLPPPNLPIPSLPDLVTANGHISHNGYHARDIFHPDSPPQPSQYLASTRSNAFTRQPPSPSLAAVAAFSNNGQQPSASSSVDDLSDPPPPSILPASSSRIQSSEDESDNQHHLMPPSSSDARPPSSRRALTRALELAREAVQLDSNNDDPQAAVMAYGRSVALLSEVMERVRRGEDTTEPRRRNGRRRNSVAQEEEVRRLQRIHDTYADRMNILSIVYSIPPIPYSTASVYSATTASTEATVSNTSPTQSPGSEISDPIPPITYTTSLSQDDHQYDSHDLVESGRSSDAAESIGAAMFLELASSASAHPYASTNYDPTTLPSNTPMPPPSRASGQARRSRAASAALPPALPPPTNSPPPAPDLTEVAGSSQGSKLLEVVTTRQRGDSVGHRRTGSGSKLGPLEEEAGAYADFTETDALDGELRLPMTDTWNTRNLESPPLPPLPSPSKASPVMPRNVPSSVNQTSSIIVPRPRVSSQASPRAEPVVINTSIAQGTISQRRMKSSTPSTPRSSSPSESIASVGSHPRSVASSLPGNSGGVLSGASRSRSASQPGRRPSLAGGRISPPGERPPLPTTIVTNGTPQRKASYPSKLNPISQIQLTVQTDLPPSSFTSPLMPTPAFSSVIPATPISPMPPAAPADPLRKPYHLMNLLRTTMTSTTGGYVTRRLHVPQEVWSQGGAKLSNLPEKVRVVGILCSALEDLQNNSSEHFGAGNVSSGMALGIGSIGRKEGEAWSSKLEDFSTVCDGVVANFGKKLGVGEGFVLKKTTWGDKLGRRFDKYINGKNLDSPAAYVQGLRKLFLHAQLLDEHTKAISSSPVAPAYAAFPVDVRLAADLKLKRCSEFFATVVLTFVIRDLSQLLDKYSKKCEKWLAE